MSDLPSNAINHYENFPVASWLCPPHLRPPIAAIYAFARTADDIADEGDASADARLADLAQYHSDLMAAHTGQPGSGRWPQVFGLLQAMMAQFQLPVALLADLLDAFAQDTRFTAQGTTYATRVDLLDYCRRSANPIGRLLLHLYGVQDPASLHMSDDICTALQLINFWQDLGRDLPSARHYVTDEACAAHGVTRSMLQQREQNPVTTQLIAKEAALARAMMLNGSQLVKRLPGRAGWELRLVVQGGLRILDKMEAIHFATLSIRPVITKWDAPLMLWRALWM